MAAGRKEGGRGWEAEREGEGREGWGWKGEMEGGGKANRMKICVWVHFVYACTCMLRLVGGFRGGHVVDYELKYVLREPLCANG